MFSVCAWKKITGERKASRLRLTGTFEDSKLLSYLLIHTDSKRKKNRLSKSLADARIDLEEERKANVGAQMKNKQDGRFIGSYFNPRGGLSLALRACVAHSSHRGIGLAMAMDVSHQTVSRWQIKLRASRLMFMRNWYVEMYKKLEDEANWSLEPADAVEDPTSVHSYTVALHFMQCDATNSNTWKKPTSCTASRLLVLFAPKP